MEGRGGDHAGSKLEEAGRAEMLEHAVLLQVIQEQQEQHKRLLEQQEKLLAVIKEQHEEMHQQRPAGEDVDMQPEAVVAVPKSKEQDTHDGTVTHPPLQPLEPELRAPGQPPALPQGHDQRSPDEPKGAAGRAPAVPPGGMDTEPRAAQAEPREGRQGAEPKVAGVQEWVPKPDLAGAPERPEKNDAGDSPVQSRGDFGGGSYEKQKSRKEAAGDLAAGPDKPQQVIPDRGLAGLSSRSGGAAPRAQAVLHQPEHPAVSAGAREAHPGVRKEALGGGHLGGDHVLAPGEDAAVREPEQRPDPELRPQQAIPEAQKPDNAKPNRDLKVQAGSDLRRRRRDVAPHADGGPAPHGGVIISFQPLPGVQISDLRSALDTQLRQAAGRTLQGVHGRQIKQLPGALEEA